MKIETAARGVAAAFLLATVAAPSAGIGAAQRGETVAMEASQVSRDQIPRDAIRVPCCRCLDGSTFSVTIDTRRAAWRVTQPNGSGPQPVVPATHPAWAAVPPAGWVGPPGAPATVGDYEYELPFYVPPCVIDAPVQLSGRFGADNRARVFIDGNLVTQSQGPPNYGFQPGSITPFTTTVTTPGLHRLRVIVSNIGGPTGLILQGTLTRTCPRDLERRERG